MAGSDPVRGIIADLLHLLADAMSNQWTPAELSARVREYAALLPEDGQPANELDLVDTVDGIQTKHGYSNTKGQWTLYLVRLSGGITVRTFEPSHRAEVDLAIADGQPRRWIAHRDRRGWRLDFVSAPTA